MPPETVTPTIFAEEYSFCNRRVTSVWTNEITACAAIENSVSMSVGAWSDGADWYDTADGSTTGWSDWPLGGGGTDG
jgi:hypothetical protein